MTRALSASLHANLTEALARADQALGLFPPGGTVVVAVSGGPDSVALLSVLRDYAPQQGFRLHVAHLDHMLRPEAVEDAAWVQQLAADWRLPITVDARDVRRVAARLGRGLEDAARLTRYGFLAEVAGRVGATRVAVAHQQEDQAETVLLKLLRGAGLAGLRGMLPLGPFPFGPSELAEVDVAPPRLAAAPWPPPVVRPFLGLPRRAILAHLQEQGIQARQDATNQDPAFRRNRLRQQVLPLLAEINPEVVPALARTAQALAGDWDFLEQAAEAIWERVARRDSDGTLRVRREDWLAQHPAIQRRLLRRAFQALAVPGLGGARELGWEAVEGARELIERGEAGRMTLPGGLQLAAGDRGFSLAAGGTGPAGLPPLPAKGAALPLALAGATHWQGWLFEAATRDRRLGEGARQGDPWRVVMDLDALGPSPVLRGRQPGDRMQPLGMGGQHKRLQDLFVDAQVPQPERDGWPVLVTADDQVAWVPGLRLDERFRVAPGTRRVLALSARPPAGG